MKQQYLIRSGALAGYENVVKALNGDPNNLLAACGLSLFDLNAPDTMIPFNVMVELLELSADKLNSADFGLTLGLNQDVDALGALGLLMQNCKNIREVIISAQRYIAVHSQAEYWRLTEEGEYAFVERFSVSQDVSHARQFKELSFGICVKLIRSLIKEPVHIEQLEFAHAPISKVSVYKRLFGCEVFFNQEHDRLVIKRQYLNNKMHSLSTDNKYALEQGLSTVLSKSGNDVERQITTLILQTLGIQGMSLGNIAGLLNTNKRTLQRTLKANNLSFKTILADVRVRTACWHLEASTMDITLLSEILGYNDISAFSKAFRKHTGLSPLQWRKSKQSKR